ncbi:hypothetical protein [Paenibacillus thiaminolyticus]|uniref:Uncharacterized protein n=1 Tax=Paenibacillus thiaminolyticus TaxID=49283 RepID=A0A3A3GQA2_PANTH|nr:hypothetical protein [Paenibacillus thiaminolyticus]RJG26721.1 hypothetical protein DQX05_01425 [Paenibacillus thiaminolyticus]
MFNIYELSDEENRLVHIAGERYGEIFFLAKEVVEYSWLFVPSISQRVFVFNAFLTQINKMISLALLSILRHHTVQSQMSLRTALESTILACYALYKPDESEFIQENIDFPGTLLEKRSVKNKAYKWIEKNYKQYSEKIEYSKKTINNLFAHSNLINAFRNVEYGRKANSSVFDMTPELIQKVYISHLTNSFILQIDLIGKVIHDYPLCKLNPDFHEKIDYFYSKNKSHFDKLKQDPDYPKLS